MFLPLPGFQSPVFLSNSPTSHSSGMLVPSGVLLRTLDPPHWFQSPDLSEVLALSAGSGLTGAAAISVLAGLAAAADLSSAGFSSVDFLSAGLPFSPACEASGSFVSDGPEVSAGSAGLLGSVTAAGSSVLAAASLAVAEASASSVVVLLDAGLATSASSAVVLLLGELAGAGGATATGAGAGAQPAMASASESGANNANLVIDDNPLPKV